MRWFIKRGTQGRRFARAQAGEPGPLCAPFGPGRSAGVGRIVSDPGWRRSRLLAVGLAGWLVTPMTWGADPQVQPGAASPAPAPGSRFTFNGAISSFLEDSFNTRLLVEFPNGLIPLGGVGSGISGPFRGAVDSNNTQLLTFPLFTVSRSAPSSVTIQGRVDDLTAPGTYPICIQVTADNDPDGIDKFTFDFRVKPPPDNFLNPGVQATGGDPVGTYAGNYVEFEPPDLNLGGPLPIFFERYYDSALFADGIVQSALGHNWQHNWDLRLAVAGTNATVAFRRGRILRFERAGADWRQVFRSEIGFRLVEQGGGFLLGDPRSQLMYFFNAQGRLARLEDGRGNTNFLSYAGELLANVTDGLGRSLEFRYDAGGLLTNVTDGVRQVRLAHTGTNLTRFTDARGKLATYTYDPANTNNPGLMTARTLPEGNTPMRQFYRPDGRVASQSDAAGGTMRFAYARVDGTNLTTTTDALGQTMIHVYQPGGELASLTDEAGLTLQVFSDAAGRRRQILDRNGVFSGPMLYDETNGLPTRLDHPANNDDQFLYAARPVNGVDFFDLARITRPDNGQDRFGYDARGNLIAFTNRNGNVWRFENNARGQILNSTNPTGGLVTLAYDASARLAGAADSETGTTTFAYDALHRLTSITHPNPDTLQFAWDALNRLTAVADERANTTAFAYDDNSRLTATTNALNQTTRYGYDALDRVVRVEDRLGRAATFGYDPRTTPGSLLAAVTNRNGFVTRFDYDARRRLTGVVDPAGRTNSFGYDNEGLVTSASNPLGETVRFRRDPMGYVTNLTDPFGNQVGLLRDQMKRVTRVTDPLGRVANFGYDARGLLVSATRGGSLVAATYTRDALGNVTRLFDPNNRLWDFAYSPMGRLTNFADPLSRNTRYRYDIRGRLATVTHADGVTQTNTYDGANNLTRLQFTDGTDLRFAYDALDRLTNAAGSDPIEFAYDAMDRVINTRQVGVDFGAGYDADGRLTSVSYNNGQFTVNYTYDSRDRLIVISDTLSQTGVTFTYDDAGRLTGMTRPNGVNGAYTYDARGLLTRIQEGSLLDLRYTMNSVGEVTEADFIAAPIDPAGVFGGSTNRFTYDVASQINSAGYAYDARGRQTNAPNTRFTWDGASRLRSINNVSFGYNALGEIVTRAEGGNTNRYFYNYALGLTPIMAERDESTGQFTRFYVWSPGGRLLYMINRPDNSVSHPLFDRVGSTLALTDASGAVTDGYAYSAHGRVLARIGANPQPFQFTGMIGIRTDGALCHMRARWYDPTSARFLSKEPIWPMVTNPQMLNPYQYALRNPLRYTDPRGLFPVSDFPFKPGPYDANMRHMNESSERFRFAGVRRPFTQSAQYPEAGIATAEALVMFLLDPVSPLELERIDEFNNANPNRRNPFIVAGLNLARFQGDEEGQIEEEREDDRRRWNQLTSQEAALNSAAVVASTRQTPSPRPQGGHVGTTAASLLYNPGYGAIYNQTVDGSANSSASGANNYYYWVVWSRYTDRIRSIDGSDPAPEGPPRNAKGLSFIPLEFRALHNNIYYSPENTRAYFSDDDE